MDARRAGKDGLRRRNVIVTVLHICHRRARLFADQAACRHIPRIESKFPKTIKAARAHIRKIQRGGAESAHTTRKFPEFHEVVKIVLWSIPGIVGKTGDKKTWLKFGR